MGLALIRKKSYLSQEIIQIIGEHHVYQDGSGYPKVQGEKSLSASGRLLGLADYFDELLAGRNSSGAFPPALAVRRMYQEAKNGKFPILYVEAMIRIFGVYPIGTLVKLSTGEDAVVVEQNPGVSVKPQVKIIRTPDGQVLDEPEMRNLVFKGSREEEIRIIQVLNSEDPSLNLRKYFS
jgi:HD-GYP domain-containing protein (c-di-GMP phosphodiesterase class II)